MKLTPNQTRLIGVLTHSGEAIEIDYDPPGRHMPMDIYPKDRSGLLALVRRGLAVDLSAAHQVQDGEVFDITKAGEEWARAHDIHVCERVEPLRGEPKPEPARMCPASLEQCSRRCTPEQVRACEDLRYGA